MRQQYVDLTDIDPIALIRAVYRHSVPRGMGLLHATEGELPEEEARQCLHDNGTISMDYVRGRGCKFFSRLKDGKRLMPIPWYDHTTEELNAMLADLGLPAVAEDGEHGCACACDACEFKRTNLTLRP
jgi:hypothetical protein